MKKSSKIILQIIILVIIISGIYLLLKSYGKPAIENRVGNLELEQNPQPNQLNQSNQSNYPGGPEQSEEVPNKVSTNLSDDPVFSDGSIPTSWENAGISNPMEFKKFLLALQTAVLNHDKNFVIDSLETKKYTKKYALDNYNTVFNKKVEDAFRDINIHQIFRNYQGAMIGAGTVWFKENSDASFAISAINN